MHPIAPSYASQFKHLALSFPSENVLHVELKRPPVNAFNEQFWREYGAAFDLISEDNTVRVVVLSSALEKTFSAGVDRTYLSCFATLSKLNLPFSSLPKHDLDDPRTTSTVSDLHALPEHTDTARRALLTRAHLRDFQNAIGAPARIPQPVIAAIHGTTLGLALDLLCAVDVRWAASDAAFGIKEVDVGLAADTGTLARMPKLAANASLVRELALSARTFGADEALRSLGFVSRVVPGSRAEVVRAAIVEFAQVVARKSPVAVVGTKQFITHALNHSVEDALEYQATWAAFALQSKDLSESAAAAKRKQKISYDNLGTAKNKTKL